ncbi:MAG TPA: hypothetical protein PKD09_13140 [Aggregatilinea sp.]|uniref:hypothetical protein n=1 Tax=Aggregatilinea sp. TaxID=2806333 RepID=UPI002C5D12BC|nr:hypothetical protein [Aggregatilinea sp.]HML22592.1 hypothetical protein [Aggregatilinea sp.]
MGRKRHLLGILAVVIMAIAACQPDPKHQVETGAELLSATFDDPSSWESGAYPVNAEEPDSTLSVVDGRFRIDHRSTGSPSFTWSLGGDAYQNVVIEVETQQISDEENNLYGVACRLTTDDSGDATGYVLLISGDGYFGFARLSNRSLEFLIDWRQNNAIRKGKASNTIRAVCVDDYLALSVNGEFLGDITDDKYADQSGQVGMVAGVTTDASVSIDFDNLIVYEGRITG